MTGNIHLTFDIDWAPDWCIDDIADILIEKGIKATWFVTHDSPVLQRLRVHSDLFELGIHPNFQKGSTQGESPEEVMEYLLNIVPETRSVRTHGLVQSSHLLKLMREDYGLEFDVSLFLPKSQYVQPHILYTSCNNFLIRIPYLWEDDFEMMLPNSKFLDYSYIFNSNLSILDFHPIHICLNSNSMGRYEACKQKNQKINECTKDTVKNLYYNGIGTATFFNNIIYYMVMNNLKGLNIAEIGDKAKLYLS